MKLEPIVFGSDTPLLGVVTPATPEVAIDRGVVICAPVGYENILHYRHLKVLARRLGEQGRPTLRFDWPACGDSSADDRDPGLVAAWVHAVSEAAAALRDRTGVAAVDVVGVRIGATLAALAAAGDPAIGDLVLWAPFTNGKTYVREMRAFHRLAENTMPAGGYPPAELDGEEISGFLLANTTIEDLSLVSLLESDLGTTARRLFLAGRGAEPDQRLTSHLAGQSGLTLETGVLNGLEDIALSWSDAPIPEEAFERIEAWLRPGVRAPVNGRVHRAEPEVMELSVNGRAIEERAVMLRDEEPLLGVVCTPAHPDPAEDDAPWVVFLSNRYARRIGPNRLYTTYARRWAAEGLCSFRLDVSATGDSAGPEQETVESMYSEQGISDARDALAYLRSQYGARRFIFVGLCSGAFTGFHAALAEPDVDGVVLIGVHLLVWTDDETTMTLASKLRAMAFRVGSWQRLLHGDVPVRKVLTVAISSALMAAKRKASIFTHRVRGRVHTDPVQETITNGLAELSARGRSLLFVFPEADPGISYLKRYLGDDLRGLVDQPTFRLEEIAGTDHTFRPFWSHDVLREEIETELRRLGYLHEHVVEDETVVGAPVPV